MSKGKNNRNVIFVILGIALSVLIIDTILHSKILLITLGSGLGALLLGYVIYLICRQCKFKKNIKSDASFSKPIKNDDKIEKPIEEEHNVKVKFFSKSCIMSDYEKEIYLNIKIAISDIKPELILQPQVNLASIITKVKENTWEYQNELYRNIDFGIFTNDYEPKIMIELNDRTHASKDRYERDLKVRNILKEAQIPLITLYSSYPNKPEYIKQRIIEALNEKISA